MISELKWKWAYFPWLDAPEQQHESAVDAGYVKVVLKSEADKVIAYNKYKRCLAMARWCRSRACFYDTMRENGPYWSVKSDRAYKWYKRWFKITERFKPSEE